MITELNCQKALENYSQIFSDIQIQEEDHFVMKKTKTRIPEFGECFI